MIRDTPGTWAFAARIAGDRGEIGVERGTGGCTEARETILRAEDKMKQNVIKRLWHGE